MVAVMIGVMIVLIVGGIFGGLHHGGTGGTMHGHGNESHRQEVMADNHDKDKAAHEDLSSEEKRDREEDNLREPLETKE